MRILARLAPLAVLCAVILRLSGPAPKPANVAPSEFSAIRAAAMLREVFPPLAHPIGTPAAAAARDRIAARLRALGYDTTLQQRFACDAIPLCGNVTNIIARRPPRAGHNYILLSAHYDSVPAGPGVSDDGAGVAALLEIARAVQSEHFDNGLLFLIDDGEEAGLLGAEGFVADEVLSRDVAVAINIENRGTNGLSNMFETSPGNRWLIETMAGSVKRPQATSLLYTIYTFLPNDTDVTVFKRAGKAAMNFAAVGGANSYHTPHDDLAHLSLRTLQHHGDNVLALLRALGNRDLDVRSNDNAVYFDVVGFFLAWWPEGWSLVIAAVALVLLLIGVRKTAPRAMTYGVVATFGTILAAAAGGVALGRLAQLHDRMHWAAHPLPLVLAMWACGLAAASALFGWFAKRAESGALLWGAGIVWAAAGVTTAWLLPGVSYLFIVPAVVLAICAIARVNAVTASGVGTAAAGLVLFPTIIVFYEGLGAPAAGGIALLVGLVATLFAPSLSRPRLVAMLAVIAAILCTAAIWVVPAVTPTHPQPLSLAYVDDSAAPPVWTATAMTPKLAAAAHFSVASRAFTPWSTSATWSAPASSAGLKRVSVSGTRHGNVVTVNVRSNRNANRVALFVHGGVVRSVNGLVPPPLSGHRRNLSFNGWRYAAAAAVQEMTVVIEGSGAVDVVAGDVTFGLPPGGEALMRARNASPAIAIQDGDVTVTRVRARF